MVTWAAERGDVVALKTLKSAGCEITGKDQNGKTALEAALANDRDDVLNLFNELDSYKMFKVPAPHAVEEALDRPAKKRRERERLERERLERERLEKIRQQGKDADGEEFILIC